MDDVLTVEQAARLLKVNPRTILRWCATNQLPHTQIGRTYRLRRADLEARRGVVAAGGPAAASGREAPGETAAPLPVEQEQAPDAAAVGVTRVMAIANQKGGVGKTTTAINLGSALAERGYRVLLIDLDAQASATLALTGRQDITPSVAEVLIDKTSPADALLPTTVPGIDLLPGAITLANAEIRLGAEVGRELVMRPIVRALAPDYHFILLDCPPSLGVLTVSALMAARELIVPIRAHLFSIMGLKLFFDTVDTVRDRLGHDDLRLTGILVNQGILQRDGGPRGAAYRSVAEMLQRTHGQHLFATTIPDAIAIEEAHQSSTSVTRWQPQSIVAGAYRRLAEEVIARGR